MTDVENPMKLLNLHNYILNTLISSNVIRWAGSFISIFIIKSRISGESFNFWSSVNSTGCVFILWYNAKILSSCRGISPITRVYKVIPRDQISAAWNRIKILFFGNQKHITQYYLEWTLHFVEKTLTNPSRIRIISWLMW